MKLEEFLRDPVGVFLDGRLNDVPEEWIRRAWDAEEDDPERSLRDFIAGDLWHEASKGCLPLAASQLRWLGHVLRGDQWVGLYRYLRDRMPQCEAEVREEFLKAAPSREAHLPPPLTRDEVVLLLGSEEAARELRVFDAERPEEQGGA